MDIDEKKPIIDESAAKVRTGEEGDPLLSPNLNLPPTIEASVREVEEPEEVEDKTEYEWGSFEEYARKLRPDNPENGIQTVSDVIMINKVIRYFNQKVIIDRQDPLQEKDSKPDFKGFIAKTKDHLKMMEEERFNWDVAFPDMGDLLDVTKEGISKYYSVYEVEYIDHKLFQVLFPLDLIKKYLLIVDRQYGKPVYDKALRYHNCLLEIFIFHHLRPDTKFHSLISTENINMVDPFLRLRIRRNNKNDKYLKSKYFNYDFDLKKLVYEILDLYFPNVTWRYIGAGQEMHRLSLKLVLIMFELGLWDYEDLSQLVNILLLKLENLNVLEKRTFLDMGTTLKNYVKFCKDMESYFYECKELVVAICVHIVLLINDRSFEQSFDYASKLQENETIDEKMVWRGAYFTNSDLSNIIYRILTTYLLNFEKAVKSDQFNRLFRYLSDFVMMITDIDNDIVLVSSKVVNDTLVKYYFNYKPLPADVQELQEYKTRFVDTIQKMSIGNTGGAKFKRQVKEMNDLLKSYLVTIGTKGKSGSESAKNYKLQVGEMGFPLILLSLMTLFATVGKAESEDEEDEPEEGKEVQQEEKNKADQKKRIAKEANARLTEGNKLIQMALMETCQKNSIAQVIMTTEYGMVHWRQMFKDNPLMATVVTMHIFQDDLHLFYVHRNMFMEFLTFFKDTISKNLKIEKPQTGVEDNLDEITDPSKTHKIEDWVKIFVKAVLNKPKKGAKIPAGSFNIDHEFSKLITYYIYVKFLLGLMKYKDTDFEEMFPGLRIMDVIGEVFFDFFFPIIMSNILLKQNSEDTSDNPKYMYTSVLKRSEDFNTVNELTLRYENNTLQEHEIRTMLFEISMMTMKLVSKSSSIVASRFYCQHVGNTPLLDMLPATKYMFGIEEDGLKYRKIVVEFVTALKIFPGNSLLTMRLGQFSEGGVYEKMVIQNHRNDTVFKVIEKELKMHELIDKYSQAYGWKEEHIQYYYFKGILHLILKYMKGMIDRYTKDPNLDTLLKSATSLFDLLKSMEPFFHKHKIEIRDAPNNLKEILQILGYTGSKRKPKRRLDSEEKSTPDLVKLRTLLQGITETIERAYRCNKDYNVSLQKYETRYRNYSALNSSSADPEPWNRDLQVKVVLDDLGEADSKNAINLARVIANMVSSRDEKYVRFLDIMTSYETQKKEALDRPPSTNIFIQFLCDKNNLAKNMISFFATLMKRLLPDLYEKVYPPEPAADKKDQKDEKDKKEKTASEKTYEECSFSDRLAIEHASNEIINTFIIFFSRTFTGCDPLRDGMYDMLHDDNKEVRQRTEFLLSILAFLFVAGSLMVLNKTFKNNEWDVLQSKYMHIAMFWKNTCEGNYEKFKKYFSEFVPTLDPGIPGFNNAKRVLSFAFYTRVEQICGTSLTQLKTGTTLEVLDRPEDYTIYMWSLITMSEFCTGPCIENQKLIYKYKTDVYMGFIRREIDFVDSAIYQLKNRTLDYILSLMEGNDKEIVSYFGSNITFDTVMNLIYRTLKRLYIYSMISSNGSKYRELSEKARREKKRLHFEDQKKREESLKDNEYKRNLVDIYAKSKIEHVDDSKPTEAEDDNDENILTDIRFITNEIMDYVKVDDWQEIFRVYTQDKVFANHVLLQIVLKLNDMLLRFVEPIAGYRISIDNVYRLLIDKYQDDVSAHIRNKFDGYEKSDAASLEHLEEKYVFYMFLTKITSEIELKNKGENVTVLFPLHPKVFFLTDQSKEHFRDVNKPEDMKVKLITSFEELTLEMDDNLETYRKHKILYNASSDEFFWYAKRIIWLLGFCLNILLIIFYRRDTDHFWLADGGWISLTIVGSTITGISGILLIIWFISRYRQRVAINKLRLKEKNPNRGVLASISRFFHIYVYLCIIKQSYAMSFLIHIAANILGLTVDYVFFSVQLLNIIFISSTTNYVVQLISINLYRR